MKTLILASSSPYRRQLLGRLQLPFTAVSPAIDETPEPGEAPAALAERLARAKASRVAEGREGALVVAADTVVILDDRSLGKPVDAAEIRAFLRALAGRRHHVVTGHCLRLGAAEERATVTTEVWLRSLSEGEIERFVARGAGLDKAGGYAIQDVGAALVDRLEGCYTNVVGMSLPAVVAAAARLGVALV